MEKKQNSKFKSFYQRNKVLCTLFCVVVLCMVVSISLLFKYFYFGNGETKYGDRLDGIDAVTITDDRLTSLTSKYKDNSKISEASVTVTGKIVYFRFTFNSTASLVEAQSFAVKALDDFSDTEKAYYDFHFTLIEEASEKNEGFKIM